MTNLLIPDHYPPSTSHNHLPIVGQLLVLILVIGGFFGSMFLLSTDDENSQITDTVREPFSHEGAVTKTTPSNIGDIAVKAQSAFVWDVRGQRVLFEKKEQEVLPLASITKLMTALVTHELVGDQESVVVPSSAVAQEGDSGLYAGEVLSQEKLRHMALVSSSNDAAYTLAAVAGSLLGDRDPVKQFVSSMNIRADELELNSLNFKNMTGLDVSETEPGAIGTAKDVSFLMEYLIEQYPQILIPTQSARDVVYNEAGNYHQAANTNVVAEHIPNLLGSKTGYTDLAGGNLTVAFDLGYNRPIVVTVLGSTRDARFTDVLTLVEAVQKSVTTSTP